MKAIGIVRRIDDLGRIVIPKEIRRLIFGTQNAEGKPMEIFVDGDSIVLKKYEDAEMRKEKEIKAKAFDEFIIAYESYCEEHYGDVAEQEIRDMKKVAEQMKGGAE